MPRKELTLKQCVEVIRYQKSHPKGTRILAERFGCGRTQIQSILKAKEEILKDFAINANEDRKRNRKAEFSNIDDAVYKWYCLGRE